MKKLINSSLAFVALLLFSTSCSQSDSPATPDDNSGAPALMTIHFAEPMTRTVGAPVYSNESAIIKGMIFVFNSSTGFLELDTTVFAGQTVAISPADLFYGQLSVDDPYVDACSEVREYTLLARRQVASVSIVTHNLHGTLQTADTNFSYVLSATPRSISFSNQFSGSKVGHHPVVKFDV